MEKQTSTNMHINWFPGHMKKTLEEMEKNIKKIDVVLYVLDARAPFSCLNPVIDRLVQNKKILYVVTKTDLVSKEDIQKVKTKFENQGKEVLFVEATKSVSKSVLLTKLKTLTKEKYERNKAKGIDPIFKVMVIGTPNTGKSTIINTLCGVKKTMTGDKAGVTKSVQWVKISDNFALLDTPGTLWPKFEEAQTALNLAFIGSIKKDVVDQEELGFELSKVLVKKYPELIKNRYKVENFDREPIEIYDDILRATGSIVRGGVVDYERGSVKFMEDFRSGRIGLIYLDD